MRFIGLFLLPFLCLNGYTQEDEFARLNREFLSKVTRQMQIGRYDQASRLVDEVLENSPRSPTAWMMKGNILLNYYWTQPAQHYLNLAVAENVFDTTSALIRFEPIVSMDTSIMIEKCFRNALQEDSSNVEYIKGICYLLAISLRTDDLKKEMERLFGHIQYMENAPYLMNDYARMLIVRGKFEEGMEIYRLVASWFPEMAGPVADIAGEYLQHGMAQKALAYADSALRFPVVDEMTLLNTAMIFSTLTYYDQAEQTLRRYARKYKNISDLFYRGLMLYAEGKPEARDSMIRFLSLAEIDRYAQEITIAEYIRDSGVVYNETSMYLLGYGSNPAYYAIPVLQRGLRSEDAFVACASSWRMGKLYAENQLWDLVRNLTDGNTCEPAELTAPIIWGYAAYRQGLWAEAESEWLKVPESHQDVADMKNYFLARICQQTSRKEEALKYRKKISPFSKAKYASLARLIAWNP